MEESTYPHPINLPNLYWSGEAFSTIQGWIEGALETSDLVLENFYVINKKKNILLKEITIKKQDEYVIIDNRYIDVKKWKHVHPGSFGAIKNHLGEDISNLFRQIKHPPYAWMILLSLQKYWVKDKKFFKLIKKIN